MRYSGRQTFYSPNGHHWTGKPLVYETKDVFSGYKDRNDRRIFEGDVISSTDYPSNEYIVHYDSLLTKFLLVSYDNRDIFNVSIDEFFADKQKVRRIGFLQQ